MDIGSFVGDDVLPVVYSIKRRILKIPFLRGDFFIEKSARKLSPLSEA
jgi:formylmethanofuran:tetrahydromethanopterin formyltransferase